MVRRRTKRGPTTLVMAGIALAVTALVAGCSSANNAAESSSAPADESSSAPASLAPSSAAAEATSSALPEAPSAGGLIGFNNIGAVKCGEFCVNVENGVKEAFPAAGYEVFVTDSDIDANKMLANADIMLQKKPKLYLNFDGGITNYQATIDKFAKAGIPMFLLAGGPPPEGTPNVWWFGANSYESGVASAQAIIDYAEANWGGQIDGVFASYLSSWSDEDKDRLNGFVETLSAKYPEFTDEAITKFDGSFAGEKIQAAASAFLSAHEGQQRLVFFTPTSDQDGISIRTAMEQVGRAKDGVIATIGGDKSGRAELRDPESPIISEIGYLPETWGAQLVPIVNQILAGEMPDYKQYYDYTVLTKDNITELYGDS